ncbi:putative bifunctional diguanylate cyclase/phosphodiesterase [Neobacillus cucumis]|uniref:putative bifunctional diguanylate cyclase/phosphodiesterase n=1 Tax=Neobacillus cucumis TaxID=1740721 RepID=UPI0028531C47|nr:bifunctional diguanylate cyclase/phosphodiesterase [Neobacillus cucumis]MDR4949518.1 bifunctional diguanylate cyclase/phosphodiesterase [Neobacillus cucumis]
MDEMVKNHQDDFSNNESLSERLQMTLAFCKRYHMSAAVCYLRIQIPPDLLPLQNQKIETHLLSQIVTRLKNSIREIDTVIKVIRTDFIILLTDITEYDCQFICERIIGVVSEQYTLDFHQISVSCYIGVCLYPYGSEDAHELMSVAKVQMYEAEKDGENRCSFYKGWLDANANREMVIENDLPYALKKGQLYVQYQPQYSLMEKRVTGVEALIRWNHPSLGTVAPGEFIDHAEEAGVLNGLFYWIFEESCKNMARARENDNNMKYSINLSVNQLLLDNFLAKITSILADWSVQAEQITLEITENIEIYTVKKVKERLVALKEMGFTIALDDFGNGYFSFSDFLLLPIDYLKLDRNFVLSLKKNKKSVDVISPIIQMAHNLGLQVIIEGIEEQEQFLEWKELGCDLIQGYFIGQPLTFEEFFNSIDEIDRRIQESYF